MERGEDPIPRREKDRPMLSAILVTLIVVLALAYALRSSRRADSPLVHRPYNNRYNDAPGAREDHLD